MRDTLPPYLTTSDDRSNTVVTLAEKHALRKLYRRQPKVIERLIEAQQPQVAAKFAHLGKVGIDMEHSLRSTSAINYLRVVLGELLNLSTPYDGEFCTRTAAMSAALILSSLPPDLQEMGLQQTQALLADLLGEFQASGRGLQGAWE